MVWGLQGLAISRFQEFKSPMSYGLKIARSHGFEDFKISRSHGFKISKAPSDGEFLLTKGGL